MEPCKVCKKTLKTINMSHVKTHDMTMEEYEAYGDVNPIEAGDNVDSVWNSIDTESTEYKVKVNHHKSNIIHLSRRDVVDLRDGRKCAFCGEILIYLTVYIILDTSEEVHLKKPMTMKKPYHKDCAIAKSSIKHRIAAVMNPTS